MHIHDLSPRLNRDGALNWAAIPAALIESELFGREKSPYTGALAKQAGPLDLADKSTIFSTRSAICPLDVQVKLWRINRHDFHHTDPLATNQRYAQLDMTILEAGATYLVNPERHLSVLGSLRTYTLSPEIEFESAAYQLTPVDTSETAAGAFGAVALRPKLSDKLTLRTRGDLGAGAAFTWSATLGFEYRFKPRGRCDVRLPRSRYRPGDADEAATDVKYDMTHYGPFFSLILHWMQK